MATQWKAKGLWVAWITLAVLLAALSGQTLAAGIEADNQSGTTGDQVVFTVSINNAPNAVASFGADIGFDSTVLRYVSESFSGTALENWSFKQISNPLAGVLRLGGFTVSDGISQGQDAGLVKLTFEVIGTQNCQLPLSALKDDVSGWQTTAGQFTYSSGPTTTTTTTLATTTTVPTTTSTTTTTLPSSGALELDNQSGTTGDQVVFTVSVNNAPNSVSALGADIGFNAGVLTYVGETFSGMALENWSFKQITSPSTGVLRLGAFTVSGGISQGVGASLVKLTFEVVGEQNCELPLIELKDDIASWSTKAGQFTYNSQETYVYVDAGGGCGGKTPCYSTIQAAVDAAASRTVILIAQGTYAESIILNVSKDLLLRGGWNTAYTQQTANSTITQAPRVPKGAITAQMITFRP